MTPLAFLRSPEASRLLERAARCAGTPLSLHFVERNQEGTRILGWGACAACRYVSGCPHGTGACRNSRTAAAALSLSQRRPMPFICHMGFACVSAPALAGHGFVLTFGPYCPAEETRALEFAALRGLAALEEEPAEHDAFPVTLDDVHRAPATAVPAVAEWTMEVLADLWQQLAERENEEKDADDVDDVDLADADTPPTRSKRRREAPPEPYSASDIAAALIGGNQPQARALLRGCLAEGDPGVRMRISLRRARIVAVVGMVLEAVERADMAVSGAWAAFPEFVEQVGTARRDSELLDAAMAVLGVIRRRTARRAAPKSSYALLNEMVLERLPNAITLEEVARRLGESASSISHRLKRKFGMSYSEYVGRLRIDKAKELLRRTKLSATDVAHRVGIKDQSHFSKQFKRFVGVSPIEYRKRHGRKG